MKKKVIIVISILILLAIGITTYLALNTDPTSENTSENKESNSKEKKDKIKMPNVSGMEIQEAIQKLQNEGFIVNEEYIKIPSQDYAKDIVVKTDPIALEKYEKNTTVTLYISSGNDGFIIEDYTSKDYIEIKKMLENYGIKVLIETTNDNSIIKNYIVKQSIPAGNVLSKGDTIILSVANYISKEKIEELTLNVGRKNTTLNSNNELVLNTEAFVEDLLRELANLSLKAKINITNLTSNPPSIKLDIQSNNMTYDIEINL